MKKKIIAFATIIVMVFTCAFVMPTVTHSDDAFAKAKTKYVKIKKTTYNKMKKTITNQSNAIASYKKTVASQKSTIQKQSTAIQNQSKLIDEQKEEINKKKQQVSWLWSTLEEFGYGYNYDTHKWEAVAVDEPEQPEPLPWQEMMYTDEVTETMAEQTGLVIDTVSIIETYRNWACYYVEADGDLYVITMNRGTVDVCQILN